VEITAKSVCYSLCNSAHEQRDQRRASQNRFGDGNSTHVSHRPTTTHKKPNCLYDNLPYWLSVTFKII